MGLYRQMIGRGLRPTEDKTDVVVLDHSGAVFLHGFVEDHVQWLLDPDKRSASAAHTKRLASHSSRLLECTQCGAVRVGGEPCFHCGFLPQRPPRAVDIVDGELGLVDQQVRRAKANTYDSAERERWHAMLMHVAMERGYKPGWAAHKHKEKFGTWPPWGSSPRPIPPVLEVRSWVRSRDIAYAKG
jgi:DNA repair protein RadD